MSWRLRGGCSPSRDISRPGPRRSWRPPASGRAARCTTTSRTSRRCSWRCSRRSRWISARRSASRSRATPGSSVSIRRSPAFLDASLDPEVRRVLLIDGPAVLGWDTWREIEARYGLGAIRHMMERGRDRGEHRRGGRRHDGAPLVLGGRRSCVVHRACGGPGCGPGALRALRSLPSWRVSLPAEASGASDAGCR